MAQYDTYGNIYTKLKNRPIPFMQNRYSSEALGDLTGLRVLDGACGTGFYSQMMVRQGAAEVIAIDISRGMIEGAQRELPPEWRENCPIHYFVGDFEQPVLLQSLGLGEMRASFDVVFAAWLLNYAADSHRLTKMFRNIFDALKPGGRLIALTPNPFVLWEHGPEMTEEEGRIGDQWQVVEKYKHGFKVHIVANQTPSVEFDSFVLYESEYLRAADAAGFPNISWQVVRRMLPSAPDLQTVGREWWKPYIDRPRGCLLFASKLNHES